MKHQRDSKIGSKLTRKKVLRHIADASLFGQLGLFVGTGFSMALTDQKAPSFGELLQRVVRSLDLDFDFDSPDNLRGRDYPSIASQLVGLLQQRSSRPKSAEMLLKREIARICNLTPDEVRRKEFSPVVTRLKPSWIITTNYDFILELLFEKAVSLLPNEALLPSREHVPVYHLHGHRLVPESIVVTADDYVELLGSPLEYRQHKLSLLLTESTTLMLGYSLGDINVRSAMKLARSFSEDRDLQLQHYEGLVVQALYVPKNPRPEPYIGRNKEVIIETSDLLGFLKEVRNAAKSRRTRFDKARETITGVLVDPGRAKKLVDDASIRKTFIQALNAFPRSYQASHVVECLRNTLDPVWETARGESGWPYYDVFLKFILDVLEGIEVHRLHPTFIEYLAENFARIAEYLEPDGPQHYGKAWAATKTWRARRSELPLEAVQMLDRYARNNDDLRMRAILKDLK